MSKEYFCIDCGEKLEIIHGLILASLRTDGDMTIREAVPGGIVFGKKLGYVCNDCSIIGGQYGSRGDAM